MTKFLEIVCNSVAVVLSTIFLPVQILMIIVLVIIEFPTTIFISKFKIGVKEYFSTLFDSIQHDSNWLDAIIELYEED